MPIHRAQQGPHPQDTQEPTDVQDTIDESPHADQALRTVDAARNALENVYAALHETRQTLMQATSQLIASQGVTIGQRLYGCLYQTDPEVQVLKQAVVEAEDRYRYIWNTLIPQAREHLERVRQEVLVYERDAWAEATHPDIVRRITELTETIDKGLPESREVYVAKHEIQQFRFTLHQLWNARQKEHV